MPKSRTTTTTTKTKKTELGPIARRLRTKFKKLMNAQVVDLAAVREGRKNAEELQRSAVTADRLAEMHPAHALYVHVQNQVSILSEQITAFPELNRHSDIIEAAEQEHMPSGPPMSPLTTSLFWNWAVFDVAVKRETIGSILRGLGPTLRLHPGFLRVMDAMQCSRLGLWVRERHEGGVMFRLRELVTDEVITAVVPSGWVGKDGELWLGRVVMDMADGLPPVFVTTPYVLVEPGIDAWMAYLKRTLEEVTPAAYEALMRSGRKGTRPAREYWNEFIFEAFANHVTEAIFLKGLPDVDESRPHSRVNSGF